MPGELAVWVRRAVVAGRFYPEDPGELRERIRSDLGRSAMRPVDGVKALIVPHAGYVYSAPVAASGYAALGSRASEVERVLLLGTCHFPEVDGLAATSAGAFETPLGTVPVDIAAVSKALTFPEVETRDEIHCRDHALEVQLPFLQVVLDRFQIIPLLVGRASATIVAELLEAFWDGGATLIVVSSDLSHYLSYVEARETDQATAEAIEGLDEQALEPRSACGRNAIAGLLQASRRHRLKCRTVDLRNSGDTAGRSDRVVGYGAFVFSDAESRPRI